MVLHSERMKRAWPGWIRWAWMLPVGQFLVASLLAAPALIADYQMKRATEDPGTRRLMASLAPRALPGSGDSGANSDSATAPHFIPTRTQAVAIFDAPGSFIFMLTRDAKYAPSATLKRSFPFDACSDMAVLFPFYAIPFWWVLGRTADAGRSLGSSAPVRLRWWDLALMLPLVWCGFFGWLAYISEAIHGAADSCLGWSYALWGVWGFAPIAVVTVWILQRKKPAPRFQLPVS
jgi:hypothetical protein